MLEFTSQTTGGRKGEPGGSKMMRHHLCHQSVIRAQKSSQHSSPHAILVRGVKNNC